MAEEIDLEKCHFQNFRRYVTVTLGSDHTAYHRASLTDLYLHTKFHWNRKNFLWTDGHTDICTDVPTDGHFKPLLILLARLGGVVLKIAGMLFKKLQKIQQADDTCNNNEKQGMTNYHIKLHRRLHLTQVTTETKPNPNPNTRLKIRHSPKYKSVFQLPTYSPSCHLHQKP